jgi:hypothetical protein
MIGFISIFLYNHNRSSAEPFFLDCRGLSPSCSHSLSLSFKSESKLCFDRRSVCQSVLEQSTHLGLRDRFLLLPDSCGFVDVRRSLSLTKGRVCLLQLLLVLASVVILESEFPDSRLPFSSPPMTNRATEVVFDPTSTPLIKS